ncbi:hypothetical protein QYM36_002460 [Artemia franciscana]|uniref:Uncharacterized protein n=1 Tax=Artemia franciscana TaxID=6661 RepID=A0AA88I8N3_ARTSF|nr:hypothetical protein QYM36_002460 [Artemia franciscana]
MKQQTKFKWSVSHSIEETEHCCAASKMSRNKCEMLEGVVMVPSCLSISSLLSSDSRDGLVEDDLPVIAFEDATDEEEEQELHQLWLIS